MCDEVLASKPTDDATLSAMTLVLRGLGRREVLFDRPSLCYLTLCLPDIDMITMFEEAYKRQPHNEELGFQTFFANVRTGNWKAAQQVCLENESWIFN